LEDARYKVWLVETYAITKHDVLGEYLCGDRSFETIAEALEYAHSEETAKRAREGEERRQREVEQQSEWERKCAEQAHEVEDNRTIFIGVVFLYVIVLVGYHAIF